MTAREGNAISADLAHLAEDPTRAERAPISCEPSRPRRPRVLYNLTGWQNEPRAGIMRCQGFGSPWSE